VGRNRYSSQHALFLSPGYGGSVRERMGARPWNLRLVVDHPGGYRGFRGLQVCPTADGSNGHEPRCRSKDAVRNRGHPL
jgi:hypothetical protein